MELSRPDLTRPRVNPYDLVLRYPVAALAAWDALGVLATGFACRSLNPPAHAGQTARAMLVILATAGLTLALLWGQGFYRNGSSGQRIRLLFTVIQSFAFMILALLVWEGFTGLLPTAVAPRPDALLVVHRNWLFSWSLAAPALILLTRPGLDMAVRRGAKPRPLRRAVLLADSAGRRRLASVFASGGIVQLRGCLELPSRGMGDDDGKVTTPGSGSPRLRDLRAMLARGEADLLLVALPVADRRRIVAIDRLMAGLAIDIWLAPPDTGHFYTAKTRLATLGGFPFLPVRDKPMAGLQAAVKRAEDLLIGLPCLVLLSPVMLLIGLAIRLSSPGPALFIQPRIGLNRRIIHMRKFRTMRVEARDVAGSRQAVDGDARVTRLGRFLRRTSLDELPQLINVLEGTMSLVGPRPHALGTEAGGLPFGEAAAGYAARHSVKPGMTGWAQVRGWRGETDTVDKLRRRVAHDLHYIAHWSLWFDLKILAMTVRTVVKGEGV